jgi:hypothetical protein
MSNNHHKKQCERCEAALGWIADVTGIIARIARLISVLQSEYVMDLLNQPRSRQPLSSLSVTPPKTESAMPHGSGT